MEAQRREPSDAAEWKVFRRGWCLGGDEFRQRMLGPMEGNLGENHSGQLRREAVQAKAERIVGEELRRLEWHEGDLTRRRKGDPEKMALAARLWRETTLTIPQIAQRVHLGTFRSANARLHEWMHRKAGAAPRKTAKVANNGRISMRTRTT